jgi:hypothetical protein
MWMNGVKCTSVANDIDTPPSGASPFDFTGSVNTVGSIATGSSASNFLDGYMNKCRKVW